MLNEITYKEFKIESLDSTFRVAKMSPVDLMAISQTIDFENFRTNKTLITFCLENTEVKVGEAWLPVKTKNREVYQPLGIENDLFALNEIFLWMMENVISQTFIKSSKSTEKTQ